MILAARTVNLRSGPIYFKGSPCDPSGDTSLKCVPHHGQNLNGGGSGVLGPAASVHAIAGPKQHFNRWIPGPQS